MIYVVVCLEELQDVRSATNVDLKNRNDTGIKKQSTSHNLYFYYP